MNKLYLPFIIFLLCTTHLFAAPKGALPVSHETISFTVELPTEIDPNQVELTFPKLKYNKKLLLTFQTDDGAASFYGESFSYTNKKWIETLRTFYHKDQLKEEGYYPSRTLHSTDGAGIEQRFTFDISAWPYQKDAATGEYWFLKSAGRYTPWCNANDLRYAIDFGNDVCFHDVADENDVMGGGDYETDEEKIAQISRGIDHCHGLFKEFLDGHGAKIMVRPSGSKVYVSAAEQNDHIQLITVENGSKTFYMRDDLDLSKESGHQLSRLFRGGITGDNSVEKYMERLREIRYAPDEEKYWFCWITHESYRTQIPLLDAIMDEFGAGGDDSLWFTTANEFYEYWYMRTQTEVTKEVNGNKITFTLTVPIGADFHHKSLSVMLSGIQSTEGLTLQSTDNVAGTTYAINEGQLLVNLNFDEKLIARAEKYTALFEASAEPEDFQDAMYFVNQLKPGVKEPFIARIRELAVVPTLLDLSINKKEKTTESPLIQIEFEATEQPIEYRISLSADEPAQWKQLSGDIYLDLEKEGEYTIYFQVRNPFGESDILSQTINYKKGAFALKGITINNGEESTFNTEVSVQMKLSGDLPTHYIISESADFANAVWQEFETPTAIYTVSKEFETKLIYAKIKNSNGTESEATTATIDLQQLPRTAVIGMAGQIKTNQTEEVNGCYLNNTGNGFHSSFANIDIVDTEGINWFKMVKSSSLITDELKEKYNFTDVSSGSLTTNDNIVFDNPDEGPYPDRYIKTGYLFTDRITDGSKRNVFMFTGLPYGIYSVRILPSRTNVRNNGNYSDNYYQVNGATTKQPTFELAKNNQHFVTFTDMEVEDGIIMVMAWKQGGSWGYDVPVNLIEISTDPKITASFNRETAHNGLAIHSGKGCIYIESDRTQAIAMHTIEGILIEHTIINEGKTTLNLPQGFYLVNGNKIAVY